MASVLDQTDFVEYDLTYSKECSEQAELSTAGTSSDDDLSFEAKKLYGNMHFNDTKFHSSSSSSFTSSSSILSHEDNFSLFQDKSARGYEEPKTVEKPEPKRIKKLKEKKEEFESEDHSIESSVFKSLTETKVPKIQNKAIAKIPKLMDRNSGSQNYKGLIFRAFARFIKVIKESPVMFEKFKEFVPKEEIVEPVLKYVADNLQGKKSKTTKNRKIADSSNISNMEEVKKFIHPQGNDSLNTLEVKASIRSLLGWFLSKEVYIPWLKNEKDSQSCAEVKAFLKKNLRYFPKIFLSENPPRRTNFDKVEDSDVEEFSIEEDSEKGISITTSTNSDQFIDYNQEIKIMMDCEIKFDNIL